MWYRRKECRLPRTWKCDQQLLWVLLRKRPLWVATQLLWLPLHLCICSRDSNAQSLWMNIWHGSCRALGRGKFWETWILVPFITWLASLWTTSTFILSTILWWKLLKCPQSAYPGRYVAWNRDIRKFYHRHFILHSFEYLQGICTCHFCWTAMQ